MARLTMAVGVLLVLLGVGVYVGMAHAPTALIPAYFGVALLVCGALANTEDAKRRMLWMHIAVTLGLVGFLLPFVRSIGGAVKLLTGHADQVLRPLAVEESMAMALICLVFTALCVRSFIRARITRTAA
ncbi:hypothetical protein [Terriglobus aquaticus]|uniref:Transmembrane protein n=1 Tax=Terriglobus aquaticus TaxID=940139 RepID=A0ABW9KIW9_9BACT|nr:hypothetical protein [Terriglobus aquaticus]